jgi:hypothetical protein
VTLSQTTPFLFAKIRLIKIIKKKHGTKEIIMNGLWKFMATTAGRIIRVVAGVALIVWGIWGLSGTAGIIVAVIGAVPLLAGLFDFCVFSPLFGGPFSGKKLREG